MNLHTERLLVLGAAGLAFAIGYVATHQSGGDPVRSSETSAPTAEHTASRVPTNTLASRPSPSALVESSVLSKLRIPVFDDSGRAHPAFVQAFQLSAPQQAAMEDARAEAELAVTGLACQHVETTERSEHSITMEVRALPEAQQAIVEEMQSKLAAALPADAMRYLDHHGIAKPAIHLQRQRYTVEWDSGGGGVTYMSALVINGTAYQTQQTRSANLDLPEKFQQLLAAVGESP
jgi:hypothetical protein